MLEIIAKGEVRFVKTHVLIGSKHHYKHEVYLNQGNGDYYEVLPEVNIRIQNAVLKLGKPKCKATKTSCKQLLKTCLTSIKCFLGLEVKCPMSQHSLK